METQITPRFVEKKTSKAGKTYFQCEASDGQKYTLHETSIYEELCKNIGKPIIVQIEISGDWKNIRKFIGSGIVQSEKINENNFIEKAKEIAVEKAGYKFKDAAMLTAYAKDIFVARNPTDEKAEICARQCAKVVLEIYNAILSKI